MPLLRVLHVCNIIDMHIGLHFLRTPSPGSRVRTELTLPLIVSSTPPSPSMEKLPTRVIQFARLQSSLLHRTPRPTRFWARTMAHATNAEAQRIHILGAGNLGQYLARGLVRQTPKVPVTPLFHRRGLLDDWEAAGEAIECVSGRGVDRTGGVDVELLENGNEPIRHLIVACKTYMTVPALKRVRSRLSRQSTIVFLQNGMGSWISPGS